MTDLDLRKYHINSVQELISFLELVEARVPEIIRQVKKMQMQNASLENVVANERKKRENIQNGVVENNNVPAGAVLTDKELEEASTNEEAARIAQMRAASENATKVFGTHPKAVTPGEVGQLAQEIKENSTKEEQPPVDNEHVAEGAEQFSADAISSEETPKPKRKGLLSKRKK